MPIVNVLQLVTCSHIRGTEKLVLNFLRQLDVSKFKACLCTLHAKGKLHEYADTYGIPNTSLNADANYPLAAIRLVRLIRRLKIDIVHVYGFRSDVVCRAARFLTDVRVVVSGIRSVHCGRKWHVFQMDRLTSFQVDHYIANSRAGQTHYQQRTGVTPSKFSTIHNGIDCDAFRRNDQYGGLQEALGLPRDAIIVTFLSAILRGKGHSTVIEALKLMREENRSLDVTVLFVGEDYSNGEIRQSVAANKLDRNILFMGFCEGERLLQVYNSTDILILPSCSEGLPNVILEAMAYGIPVIASNVGGIAEAVVEGQTGYLVPPEDPVVFVERLRQLSGNPALRKTLGAQGRRRAVEHFSLKDMTLKLEDKYLTLLQSRTKPALV